MKRIIALTAFMTWQIVFASTALGQQRPGNNRTSEKDPVAQSKTPQKKTAKAATSGQAKKKQPSDVRTASHPGIIVEDEIVHEGGVGDGHIVGSAPCNECDSCGEAGCASCNVSGFDNLCYQDYGRLYISLPAHGWVHAEGLTWYQSGMRLPALVTTSPVGTARSAAGVLGQNTTVLFGDDDDHLDDSTGGFRIRFGTWLGAVPGLGLEGEYVGLSQKNESFFDQSTGATGSRILARPFFNMLSGRNDSELVSFPNVVRGSIGVDLTNKLDGAAFRFRRQICCNTGCGFSNWACQTVPVSTRLDMTAGYRYWELDESIRIREQLTTLAAGSTIDGRAGTFDIIDRFTTKNQFNGAELGVIWQGRRGWWSMDLLTRVGIGNNLQTVTINGSTAITENNQTTNHNSGFLTQRTNIGTYERSRFTMIPELGATVGYQMTRRLRATVGYSLIYFGNVVRPGDQIDLDVNPNLLPPETSPFTGALRPQFQFRQTDYWVQGLSYGLEFRW